MATAFALAVTHPTAGNIGGGGFLVYRPATGEPVSYDFREMAPAKSSPTMFMKDGKYDFEIHHNSYVSVGVPGTVAGLHMAWKDSGKLPWRRLIEPAIALSVVYVGADNLLVAGGGRDTRAWVAFAFGLIHGFGFANVLRDMDLPARALGWTLFSFNIGVEIGQLAVVGLVASLLARIRARSEVAGRRLAFAGSIVVMLAGAFWFVQRVFFSGGTA